MKTIDWSARLSNKAFWVAIIPAVLLLIQQVAGIFGFTLDLGTLQDQLVSLVGTVFMILAILGIVANPTTPGITDTKGKHVKEEADE